MEATNETGKNPAGAQSSANGATLSGKLAAGRELCPDCGRMKARNADDCCAGDCSKWYAIRDLECRQECEEIAAQKAANGKLEGIMETVFISLERMQELAQNPGLAFVLKEGRWKYSTWETYKSGRKLSCKQ